jgi:hypothetical protein
MKSAVRFVRTVGDHQLEVAYADGITAVLDFSQFLSARSGPVIDALREQATFSKVQLEDGVVTWPTGFDICPDVLRFWCEQGRICPDRETDAHFESQRPISAS